MMVGELDDAERNPERQGELPHLVGPCGPGGAVSRQDEGRRRDRPGPGLQEASPTRVRGFLPRPVRGCPETPCDGASEAPRTLREGKQQGRQDRAEAPGGRQVEKKGLQRRRCLDPGDGPDQEEDVHGEQQADARPRQDNGRALDAFREARGEDGLPDADEQVKLGEHSEADDDEPKGAEGQ